MSTPRDLINGAMRLIGVLASGETLASEQANDALTRLNSMIKSWSIDGFMVYKVVREELTMLAQASQTLGSGGNISTTRPEKIERLGIKNGSLELPVEIITSDEWAKIPNKSTTSSYPYKCYVEGTYPLETLNFWPVPTSSATLVMQSRKVINSTFALTDTISLPDGYEEVIEYNLAVRLAPEYGKQIDPLVLDTAMELKAQLMRQNTKPNFMESDAPVSRGRFYFTRGW